MNRRLALLAISLLALSGCATSVRHTTLSKDVRVGKAIVPDAVTALAQTLPPAQTRLLLARPVTDAAGNALLADLRSRGYAVEEMQPGRSHAADAMSPLHVKLDYRVSQLGDGSLYMMVVQAGAFQLSRVYIVAGDKVGPAGDWVRRE